METIGIKIMEYRRALGVSQEELAGRLNVSRQTIIRWETGKSRPDAEKVVVLSEVFGIEVTELLGLEHNRKIAAIAVGETAVTDGLSDSCSEKESVGFAYDASSAFRHALFWICVSIFTLLTLFAAAVFVMAYSFPKTGDDAVQSVTWGISSNGVIAVVVLCLVVFLAAEFLFVARFVSRKKRERKGSETEKRGDNQN